MVTVGVVTAELMVAPAGDANSVNFGGSGVVLTLAAPFLSTNYIKYTI